MDLQNIGEFHCAVCFELFGEGIRCPRMLTCGHSFCHSCLEYLLVQSPTCPNCKHGIQFPNIESIPVNYTVKSVISRFNVNSLESNSLNKQNTTYNTGLNREFKDESVDSFTLKKEVSSKELPHEGYCEDHNIYKHLRCMDCKCWVCGVCATLNHKACRAILVAEALKELKQETSQVVQAEMESQNFQNKNLDKYVQDLDNKRASLKNEIKKLQLDLRSKIEILKSFSKTIEKLQLLKSERKKYCEKVKVLETTVIASANDDEFLKATSKLIDFLDQSRNFLEELTTPRSWYGHLTLEVLKEWCQEGSVHAFRRQNGKNQYGKVEVKKNRVLVHCFQPQIPQQKDVIISFRELLLTFNGSLKLPTRGFLQFEGKVSNLGDVVIAMDALTPRAMNFLLLCSGIKGRSYEGVRIRSCDGWTFFGTWAYEEAVVKGIKDGGVYDAPDNKGFVWGESADDTDSLSNFYISFEDYNSRTLNNQTFGFVEEGLDVCGNILFSIKHCGLVI